MQTSTELTKSRLDYILTYVGIEITDTKFLANSPEPNNQPSKTTVVY